MKIRNSPPSIDNYDQVSSILLVRKLPAKRRSTELAANRNWQFGAVGGRKSHNRFMFLSRVPRHPCLAHLIFCLPARSGFGGRKTTHLPQVEQAMVEALRLEKERSEQLLLNIVPRGIVTRMNGGETIIADQRSDVTILFADLVAFTKLTSRLSAGDLVHLLNSLFSEFDRLALSLGVEKIKTVGDSYMVAGGLPEARADHAHAVADMALAMIATVERMNRELPIALQMRIGIHSGDVVAGVIGTHKFVYDIWGDAVNIASRMESHSLPNRIQISAATYQHLHKRFRLEPHGSVDVKGKGLMDTYFLLGRADT